MKMSTKTISLQELTNKNISNEECY